MPNVPCINANVIAVVAMRWCHILRSLLGFFLFRIAINAVIKKHTKVVIPRYMFNGRPKIE